MIAVDTNLVVRLITADEPKQTAIARRLFEKETVFLSRTVLQESFWVLRATESRNRESPLPSRWSLALVGRLESSGTIKTAASGGFASPPLRAGLLRALIERRKHPLAELFSFKRLER